MVAARAAVAAVALGTAVSSALGQTVLAQDVVNSVVAGAQCLLWYGGGCSAIRDKELCLATKDGGARRQDNGIKAFGEPCLWCGGRSCTEGSEALCAPLTFVTGQVTANAETANCSYAKTLSEEGWDTKIAKELVTPKAVQTNLSFSKVKTPGQVSGGQACRASSVTDDHDPDGVGRNYYAVWTAHSLQECFDICSYAKDCTGVEFQAAKSYCEVWHMPISWTQAEAGFQCYRAVAEGGPSYDPDGFWDGEQGVVDSGLVGESSDFLAKKAGMLAMSAAVNTFVTTTALEVAAVSAKQRSAPVLDESEDAAPEKQEASLEAAAPQDAEGGGIPLWIPILVLLALALCAAAGFWMWYSSSDTKKEKDKKKKRSAKLDGKEVEGRNDAAAEELQPLVPQAKDLPAMDGAQGGAPAAGVATGNWFQPVTGMLPTAQAWMPGSWGNQQPRYELLAVNPEQEQAYQQQTHPGFVSQQLQWLNNYDQWAQAQPAQRVATMQPGTGAVNVSTLGGVRIATMGAGAAQIGTGAVQMGTVQVGTGHLQEPTVRELSAGSTCPACGNVYASDAVFCRKCGRKRDEVPGAYMPLG
eukprot:TRINITY_DN9710_c0_g1_i1.p1 TRINITY_DN9710_c0_g1~~TRINITY_DN9710_c0_g1_i1.p1  ORF type:complete len:584 (+),score=109.40 TRINITY_DN9710_c0_g1_i1:69-1820(+)